jgi:hypothetical protein
MGIPNKQIGWSNEANLLYEILKKLDQLVKISGTTTPTTTLAP